MLIIVIIGAVILHSIYHKIVDVTYFSFAAVIKEWLTCFVISLFLCSAIF